MVDLIPVPGVVEMPLPARNGTVLCCVNGHKLARLTRDVRWGDLTEGSMEELIPRLIGSMSYPICHAPHTHHRGTRMPEGVAEYYALESSLGGSDG